MIELGVVDAKWKVAPSDAKPFKDLTDKQIDDVDLRMAIYAAQVDRMDQGIGRIVAALEKEGILDNTLVLFMADNGACAEIIERGTGGESAGRSRSPATASAGPGSPTAFCGCSSTGFTAAAYRRR